MLDLGKNQMKEVALIIHFIGLAMGLGTSIAFMFLGIKSSKMEEHESLKFQLNTLVLSKMGHIGLVLLIVSGVYLMTPYWNALPSSPLLIAKLLLVVVLVLLIGIINTSANKAKAGDAKIHFGKIEIIGKVSLLTTLIIVILAVYIFH